MASITTRAGKGTPLTNAEIDANFTNLNTDKLEGDFSGLTEVTSNSGTDTVAINQTGSKRTTLQKIRDWIVSTLTKSDVGLSNVPNVDVVNTGNIFTQNQSIKNADSSVTRLTIGNTNATAGDADLILDGQDGDGVGGDYAILRQKHGTKDFELWNAGSQVLTARGSDLYVDIPRALLNTPKVYGNGTGNTNIASIQFYESDKTTRKGFIGDGASGNSDMYIGSDAGNVTIWEQGGAVQGRAWHAGNDGAGSGLDADTVDGVHGTSIFRNDAGNATDVRFTSGSGRGVRFWDSDAYKIFMASATDGAWGGRNSGDTTSDYNMYFRFGNGGTNRGFVFESAYATKLFSINPDKVRSAVDVEIGTVADANDRAVRVLAADTNKAGFEAYGNSQGTGYVFVGQSGSYGGGMFYNGDGTPAFATGEAADRISFFRRDTGASSVVFSYPYNGDVVDFKALPTINGSTLKTSLSLAKADVGLSNVDNTSDANKPISTATQTALDGKSATSHTHVAADIAAAVRDLAWQTDSAAAAGAGGGDFNTIVTPGIHPVLMFGTNANGPGTSEYYYVTVYEYASSNLTQMLTPYTTGGVWYRYRYNGTWGSWRQLSETTHSHAAITINGVGFSAGSSGTIYDSTKLPTAGGGMTGLLSTKVTGHSVGYAGGDGALSVRGDAGSAAVMTYHRSGAYAINMGLDTDNVFRLGGWSNGTNVYRWQSYTNGDFKAAGKYYVSDYSETGIFPGNADACNKWSNNLKLSSWFGIGFGPSISGQPVPLGEYSHWFDTRTGNSGQRGELLFENSAMYIKHYDTSWGASRWIHSNDGAIGFLNSGGSWAAYSDNNGNWVATSGVYCTDTYLSNAGDWCVNLFNWRVTKDNGHNNVGSFVFAAPTSTMTLNPGDLVAGSSLSPGSVSTGGIVGSGTLSGTWRCLGYVTTTRISLYQRVS